MEQFLFMGLGGQEILVIALIVLLLFGGKKIPELMKGLGKGVRSFKDGMNDVEKDVKENGKPENNDKPKSNEAKDAADAVNGDDEHSTMKTNE
jgi:sec-independent protein translocase protein TatA